MANKPFTSHSMTIGVAEVSPFSCHSVLKVRNKYLKISGDKTGNYWELFAGKYLLENKRNCLINSWNMYMYVCVRYVFHFRVVKTPLVSIKNKLYRKEGTWVQLMYMYVCMYVSGFRGDVHSIYLCARVNKQLYCAKFWILLWNSKFIDVNLQWVFYIFFLLFTVKGRLKRKACF